MHILYLLTLSVFPYYWAKRKGGVLAPAKRESVKFRQGEGVWSSVEWLVGVNCAEVSVGI